MKELSEWQKGYLSGLVDGEGTISVTMDRGLPHPYVQISNTDKKLLEWVRASTGLGGVYSAPRTVMPLYRWLLRNYQDIFDFLGPLDLISKRRHIPDD